MSFQLTHTYNPGTEKVVPKGAVVLDFGGWDRRIPHLIAEWITAHANSDTTCPSGSAAHMVAQEIEAQAKPPKPAEPTGLAAVVEDESGNYWVRMGDGPAAWQLAHASPGNRDTYAYSTIGAVRVLSLGVTE